MEGKGEGGKRGENGRGVGEAFIVLLAIMFCFVLFYFDLI